MPFSRLFLTDMLCFFSHSHILIFLDGIFFQFVFFVWVSPCLSDLTSGWDWGKVLPFSEHIPLFSAAPMDHKNIGTRMAPTTFCGYNLHLATWDFFCSKLPYWHDRIKVYSLTFVLTWFCSDSRFSNWSCTGPPLNTPKLARERIN